MKKILLTAVIALVSVSSFAQKITKVELGGNGNATIISVTLDESVVMNLSQNGDLAEWGVNRYAERPNDYIPRKLDEYTGRVEYYNESDNEAFRGKIKYIGKTLITYYASFDNQFQAGRIKSIGGMNFDYYNNYDEVGSQGKIKSAGTSNFTYYSSYENEAIRGKIKNVGSVSIEYYSSISDKAIAGKVKSINGSPFVYYTSQDQVGLRGALKTGRQIQVINGITFWVKYS
jgi:hypothetical protein